MARKTREKAMLTREQLLDAAEHVFRARGVGHASLAEVADAAGVTRGAVYWHFDSKAALFLAMVDRVEMPQEASLRKMKDAAEIDPLAALRAATIDAVMRVATDERTRRVYDVVFLRCEYTEDLATVREQHMQSRQTCYENIERTMRAAVRRGQLPAHLDVACATRGLFAFIGGLMRDSIEAPEEIDLVRNAEALVDTYLLGLVHSPARKSTRRSPAKRTAESAQPRSALRAESSRAPASVPTSRMASRPPPRALPAGRTRTASVRSRKPTAA
jgi:TetR/AcrR family acrAB operon transcriptional repressor